MKILKIKLSTDILKSIGYYQIFSVIKFYEVIESYQYDRTNFFSKQRIVFKPGIFKDEIATRKCYVRM